MPRFDRLSRRENVEKDVRLFSRVAQQRLAAAEFLLEDEAKRFNRDAIYLAGYAVECALKAMNLQRTPKKGYRRTLAELTGVGSKGHDFEYLKSLLKKSMLRGAGKDREHFGKLTESFRRVNQWSVELRYQPGLIDTKDATLFLEATREILRWCLRG